MTEASNAMFIIVVIGMVFITISAFSAGDRPDFKSASYGRRWHQTSFSPPPKPARRQRPTDPKTLAIPASSSNGDWTIFWLRSRPLTKP